jgi:hypothetical protein
MKFNKKTFQEAINSVEAAKLTLEELANQAEEFFDEKSEAWQEGEKGGQYQEKMDTLTDITNVLSEVIDDLKTLTE